MPAASQEWNERVDIEPLPTHERSCFVSGHDFSRAAHQPSTMGFSPCSYLEHILFIRSVPGFPTSPLSPAPLMWFSLKRTTCSWPKPQVSTGNLGEPTCPGVPWRDLQFDGPFVEIFFDRAHRRPGNTDGPTALSCRAKKKRRRGRSKRRMQRQTEMCFM